MEKFPLVSVVVPCYNHELYIEECIESIVNQTYKNIQLIVIDDGSKDRSPEILKQLQQKYGFILECQENMGLSKTLNKALNKYVQGEYFCAIASDDYWCLDKIEKQVNYMKRNPDMVLSFGKCYHVDNGIIINQLGNIKERNIQLSFESLFKDNFIPAVTVMQRTNIMKELGGFKENSYIEDWELWLRIVYKYPIGYIDEFLAYYRAHGTNISKNDDKMTGAIYQIVRNWEFEINHKLYTDKFIKARNHYFNVLSGKNKKKALRYWPLHFKAYFDREFLKGLVKLIIGYKSRS